MSWGVRGRPHIQLIAIFSSQISNLIRRHEFGSDQRLMESSMFTGSTGATLRPFSWAPVRHASGGCRRHRTSPTIPSEPPSLAHPTRRAAAAEKGGPSLWWARASEVLLPAWARSMFRLSSFGLPARTPRARGAYRPRHIDDRKRVTRPDRGSPRYKCGAYLVVS
jgi:hypothetical protein